MSRLLYLNVGENAAQFYSSLPNPQLQFFENWQMKNGTAFFSFSQATFSFHQINIPLSLSFNNIIIPIAHGNLAQTVSISIGLYSLSGSSLSLANSASASSNEGLGASSVWLSLATSATQNITPGAWYLGIGGSTNLTLGGASFLGNITSINPGNAQAVFLMGRMTVSSNAPPTSVATSDLDITGSDAISQPYIIITS